MALITLIQAEAQRDAWLAASLALARNESYRIGERMLTRADASDVKTMLDYWESKVERLDSGRAGIPVRMVTPRLG